MNFDRLERPMSSVNSFQGFFYDWITQDLRSTTRKLSTSSSITVKRKARWPINFLLIVQYTHANAPINHAVNPLYLFIKQVKMNDAIGCASYQCMPLRLRFLSEPPTPVDVFQPRRAIVKNERSIGSTATHQFRSNEPNLSSCVFL